LESELAPMDAPPSRNVTVPVGVPAPGGLAFTVAVKVIAWPNTDGLTELVTAVELFALLTVCVMAAEVLAVKFASPAYVTVIVWFPTASERVLKVALPAVSVPLPMLAPPSRNVTVPLGVPVPELAVTVAVNVTAWPNTDGFTELATVVEVLLLLTVC